MIHSVPVAFVFHPRQIVSRSLPSTIASFEHARAASQSYALVVHRSGEVLTSLCKFLYWCKLVSEFLEHGVITLEIFRLSAGSIICIAQAGATKRCAKLIFVEFPPHSDFTGESDRWLVKERKSRICHRMAPMPMLYSMTLTDIFEVTKF